MGSVLQLLRRGIQAGLLGIGGEIWTLSDTGWIYECRLTNPSQSEYHGYPVRGSEAIAELVYARFASWVRHQGGAPELAIIRQCKALYGFRS